MLIDSVIFIQILPRVHSKDTSHGHITCGLRDVWSSQRGVPGLPSTSCVWGDHWESSQIALTGYLVVMLT